MFHFNKKHIEDPAIPMWVIKARGETYYVQHVDCSVPWSTKETPDNSHTKGSIKVRDCLVTIDEENCATIAKLNIFDKIRLRNAERGITRVIIKQLWIKQLKEKIQDLDIKHGPFKSIGGACTSTFYITDIYDREAVLMLQLALSHSDLRVLKPNEGYYKYYDDPKYHGTDDIDLDAEDDDLDD